MTAKGVEAIRTRAAGLPAFVHEACRRQGERLARYCLDIAAASPPSGDFAQQVARLNGMLADEVLVMTGVRGEGVRQAVAYWIDEYCLVALKADARAASETD